MEPMSAGWQAVCYGAAIVIWLIATFAPATNPPRLARYNLVALGLAVATFVWWFNALAATT